MKRIFILCLFFIGFAWVMFAQTPFLPNKGSVQVASAAGPKDAYEVWAIDQATSLDGTVLGGNLYILSGNDQDFIGGTANIKQINLAANAVANGFEKGSKPHWLVFNKGATHAIVGHASSGHVYAIDASNRQVVDVVVPGGNSHAVSVSPDNTFVLAADTPGQQVHKIPTNYQAPVGEIFGTPQTLKFDSNTLQALGTNTANPVVAQVDETGQWAYVTFAQGGAVIVNTQTMTVAHIYSSKELTFNGLVAYDFGKNFITNAGNANPEIADFLYFYDHDSLLKNPTTRPPVIKVPQSGNDVHGLEVIGGKYLWQLNRASNNITIHELNPNPFDPNVEGSNKVRAVNLIDLANTALGPDPTPDLGGVSPSEKLLFVSQRGPVPQSANDPAFFNSVGIFPGVGIIQIEDGGKNAKPAYLYRFDNLVNGINVADFHALGVRK
ncbi:hypothetical protein F7734_12075 [Scytonema sp. UIC 10036]|uniref:YncE family protein n=1 Tax=Scytonema sp. UIC 10036 TaxID=2304196 RepID=UPI0012DA2596|nr:hypothetical protein [Scytonema sp. UIC 10036]MUG93133.1 hypothetical protein [Scytonema sp. UIC 10036]